MGRFFKNRPSPSLFLLRWPPNSVLFLHATANLCTEKLLAAVVLRAAGHTPPPHRHDGIVDLASTFHDIANRRLIECMILAYVHYTCCTPNPATFAQDVKPASLISIPVCSLTLRWIFRWIGAGRNTGAIEDDVSSPFMMFLISTSNPHPAAVSSTSSTPVPGKSRRRSSRHHCTIILDTREDNFGVGHPYPALRCYYAYPIPYPSLLAFTTLVVMARMDGRVRVESYRLRTIPAGETKCGISSWNERAVDTHMEVVADCPPGDSAPFSMRYLVRRRRTPGRIAVIGYPQSLASVLPAHIHLCSQLRPDGARVDTSFDSDPPPASSCFIQAAPLRKF
ncbi:hypothetical protein R3P38DRAFT_3170695 [Favolaschia claudopus]|uniref:Uncharacterized protein n=1 Tax=Favolaschia claudopus TaxID=2862362 RepID=A0AAW0DWL3_9AGAR